MKNYSLSLFIEINNSEFTFVVGDKDEKNNFKIIYKSIVSITGIEKSRIINFDQVFNDIKKNIYLIEQKINFTFKETILILSNFNCSFVNLSGFKKLNGSQILKENITYILNSLKSNISETERDKTILHIFNSNYYLDKKKIENLPIGLFGYFYSHELSFCLISNNDYKNLNNIFNKCNLKIKKIILKSFAEGSCTSNKNERIDTFFQIKINKNNSQIFYFENDSLKFEQNFNFGSDLIIKDISKVTSLNFNFVKKLLDQKILNSDIHSDELIEQNLFDNENYIKIKKKLIYNIAEARINEILEHIISKNINLSSFNTKGKEIFLKIGDESHRISFKNIYSKFFNKNNNLRVRSIENITSEDLFNNINNLVLFGWKKEAIPISFAKKSVMAKLFDTLFG
jgi:cell division protein FtsA